MNIELKHVIAFKSLIIKLIKNKSFHQFSLVLLLLFTNSCITQFIPDINEEKELLVVEGLITNEPVSNTINLSVSLPVGKMSETRPLSGCTVIISDDIGNNYSLNEKDIGAYVTDSVQFKGEIGRKYILKIILNKNNRTFNYQSYPVEMKPVPAIDSLFYEKMVIQEKFENFPGVDACQIYLNTHDPENKCRFFRWEYEETWILRLLWPVDNMKCWISDKSKSINIRNTSNIEQATISRYPINYISNATDRLRTKYSILVNQYSLNKEEYNYWEDLQNLTVQVGGLSDIIPFSIPSNLFCVENTNEKVLGYFSVSAKSSKRIFIEDNFAGIVDDYANCPSDTIPTDYPFYLPGFNVSIWALLIHKGSFTDAPYTILTERKGCADCTERGTTKKPDFWIDDK